MCVCVFRNGANIKNRQPLGVMYVKANKDLSDFYTDIIKDLMNRFYSGVTRYTTSAFLRMKLGDALEQRDVAPYIFESAGEARRHVRDAQSGLTDEELEIASYGGTG